jgi:hypothetical protein
MKHVNDEQEHMKQADENVVDQVSPDPVYISPRLVFLGQATDMIRGGQNQNYQDTQGPNWYWYGE